MEETIEKNHFKTDKFDEASDRDKNINIGNSSDVSEAESPAGYQVHSFELVRGQCGDQRGVGASRKQNNSFVVTQLDQPCRFQRSPCRSRLIF